MSIKEKNGQNAKAAIPEEIYSDSQDSNKTDLPPVKSEKNPDENHHKVVVPTYESGEKTSEIGNPNRLDAFIDAYNAADFQNKIKLESENQKLHEQLSAKQQLLSSYIHAVDTTNASVEFDLEGMILSANKNFLDIMGYSKEELIGRQHSFLVDPSYAASQKYKGFWNSLKKGEYQKNEFVRVAKNGTAIWFLGSYNPIFDSVGKPYKILKIATDITLAKTQFLQLAVQAKEKEKRAEELITANKELAFQNKEKEKRAAELIIANKELKFQNQQKEKRAEELILANKELAVQSREKEARAAELIIANKELKFQNEQKEKRAEELILANKELAVQSREKEARAAELIIANKELKFQNEQKEKRAQELIVANKELAFQSEEKQKRAAELIVANKKLASENILKEKRKAEKEKKAAELIVTNRELAYQEKRGQELTLANEELKKAQEELESFSYSVSHDLRAPIRAINGYTQILVEDYNDAIDPDGQKILDAIIQNSKKMGILIDDLLAFSKLGRKEVASANINMKELINSVIKEMTIDKGENIPSFEIEELTEAAGDPSLIRQVWVNLISNAVKYSKYKAITRIKITSAIKEHQVIYSIQDWGAGFDMEYYDKLFGVFQRLHSQEEFVGTGIGLAIVEKIINRHNGTIWAESQLDAGAVFHFSLPAVNQ